MSLLISDELHTAVQAASGKPVHLTDPQTQEQYVVIPAAVYNELTAGIPQKLFSKEEQVKLLVAAGLRAGWDDPAMDIYNDVEPES